MDHHEISPGDDDACLMHFSVGGRLLMRLNSGPLGQAQYDCCAECSEVTNNVRPPHGHAY